LSDKLTLLTRGDLGAGEAFTGAPRSASSIVSSHGAVPRSAVGPSASTRDADEAPSNAAYDMTHYGPFFSLTLHWKQK
jgi:hypothetical protein